MRFVVEHCMIWCTPFLGLTNITLHCWGQMILSNSDTINEKWWYAQMSSFLPSGSLKQNHMISHVCVYIYTYMYIHIYIYTYIHTYISIYIYIDFALIYDICIHAIYVYTCDINQRKACPIPEPDLSLRLSGAGCWSAEPSAPDESKCPGACAAGTIGSCKQTCLCYFHGQLRRNDHNLSTS